MRRTSVSEFCLRWKRRVLMVPTGLAELEHAPKKPAGGRRHAAHGGPGRPAARQQLFRAGSWLASLEQKGASKSLLA